MSEKFGCNTGLNSSQAIIMSVRPCPVLLKASGMLWGNSPSSNLRFKHENIAFIKTTHATKISVDIRFTKLWHTAMTLLFEPYLYTVMKNEGSFGLAVV